MKKFTRVFVLALASLTFFSYQINPVAASVHFKYAPQTTLSSTGVRAFSDLGRCLQSNNTLDVFYLIDESASLQNTDPENSRASILGSSLRELSKFRSNIKVNYSVGFFADKYATWRPWTEVTSNNIDSQATALEAEVRNRNNGNWTDWLKGMNGAIGELSAQHSRTRGCQTLVWLTDGGIQLSTTKATENAYSELCSNTFNAFRQSNVTVLGVLLKNDSALNNPKAFNSTDRKYQLDKMTFMRPLVEGDGQLFDGTNLTCGTTPIPANYSAGALFVAQDPIALAFEFLRLNSQIEGCTDGALGNGNVSTFVIESGIARFRLITTSKDWKLISPNGREITPATKGIDYFASAGAAQVTVPVDSKSIGNWTFNHSSASANQLCLFSGLGIKLDAGQLVAGKPGTISGKIVNQGLTQQVDMGSYGSSNIGVQSITSSGKPSPTQVGQISPNGTFTFENFTPESGQGRLEIRVTLNVSTRNGVHLTPVSVSQMLEVRLPSNYPSLSNAPISLTDLKGKKGKATGAAVFNGPTQGSGKVCIPQGETPNVVSDSLNRQKTYAWTIAGVSNNCLSLSPNDKKSIIFTVKNSVAADAHVSAEIPVTYYSSEEPGKNFTLTAPIQFTTTKPTVGVPYIVALLVLLGILLPLFFIYGLTYFTTKFAFGKGVQVAQFPVLIHSTKGIVGTDGMPLVATPEKFIYLPAGSATDVRSYQTPIGTIRTRVSKLVFPNPWFEIAASSGNRIITNVPSPTRLRKRFKDGKVAQVRGNLDGLWALSIRDSDFAGLAGKDAMPANLIVYKRNNVLNPNQHIESLSKVTTTPHLWQKVATLIPLVTVQSARKPAGKLSRKAKETTTTPPAESKSPAFPPSPGTKPIGGGTMPPAPGSKPQGGGTFPPPPASGGGGFPPPPAGA